MIHYPYLDRSCLVPPFFVPFLFLFHTFILAFIFFNTVNTKKKNKKKNWPNFVLRISPLPVLVISHIQNTHTNAGLVLYMCTVAAFSSPCPLIAHQYNNNRDDLWYYSYTLVHEQRKNYSTLQNSSSSRSHFSCDHLLITRFMVPKQTKQNNATLLKNIYIYTVDTFQRTMRRQRWIKKQQQQQQYQLPTTYSNSFLLYVPGWSEGTFGVLHFWFWCFLHRIRPAGNERLNKRKIK